MMERDPCRSIDNLCEECDDWCRAFKGVKGGGQGTNI